MATGLVIDGIEGAKVWGPLNGLGVAWSSSQIPAQYVGAIARDAQGQIGFRAMKSLCNGELIPATGRGNAFAPSNTCGIPGSMACSYGSPESGLAGLGGLGAFGNLGSLGKVESVCKDWAAVMNQMQALLLMAEEQGLTSSIEYLAARNYFDDTTGFFGAPVFRCASAFQAATMFYNDLNRRLGNVLPKASQIEPPPPPSLLPNLPKLPDADKVGTIVKWVAIGAVALAGAYALGPILRGAAGLIPKRKG